MIPIQKKLESVSMKNMVQILYKFQNQKHFKSLLKSNFNFYICTLCLHKASENEPCFISLTSQTDDHTK